MIDPEVEESLCSSPNIIESTPENDSKTSISNNLEDDCPGGLENVKNSSKSCSIDINNHNHQESLGDVKFLPVNQFRLTNDEERNMCIKQQKNSWLQLNDSKKDFQSVIDKSSSVMGPLSTLKRDRQEHGGHKRVKRKISDYFLPKI